MNTGQVLKKTSRNLCENQYLGKGQRLSPFYPPAGFMDPMYYLFEISTFMKAGGQAGGLGSAPLPALCLCKHSSRLKILL